MREDRHPRRSGARKLRMLRSLSHPESPPGNGPVSTPRSEGGRGSVDIGADPAGLVGRQREATELISLVGEPGLVTVAGPAGVGKSRLASEVAAGWDLGLDAAPCFVDLSGAGDPGAAVASIAAGLGALGDGARDLSELAGRVRGRCLLVVLDSCEHLLGVCAEVAEQLLGEGGGLTLLTTSREPLGISGERVLRLAPLSLPPPGESSPDVVATCDSVRLFLRRRGPSGAPVVLTTADAGLVARICRATDGLPRYLESAAAALRVMDLRQLVAAIEAGPVPDPNAGPTVDLDHSWRLLTPAQARLLRRLSVFVGGWSLDGAQQVCAGHGLGVEEVVAAHGALVAKSLIIEGAESPVRHSMLETTRRVVRAKAWEPDRTNQKLAEWCLSLVQGGGAADLVAAADEAWLRQVDLELENCCSALEWARREGHIQIAVRLASEMAKCWGFRGYLHEAREWLDWAMSQHSALLDPQLRATVVRRAAVVHGRLGDAGRARELAAQATTLFREIGDAEGATAACAFISLSRSPRELLPGLDESIGLARVARDVTALGYLLSAHAQAEFFLGRLERARHDFEECVGLGRRERHGDVLLLGLLGLARVDLVVGNCPLATRELGDALALAERSGDQPGRDLALTLSGELSRIQGDYRRARASLAAAATSLRSIGESVAMARNLLFTGRLDQATGASAKARAHFEASLVLGRSANAPPYHEARCLLGLASCAIEAGEVTLGEALAEEARALAAANHDRLATADCLRLLARCGRAAGRSCGPGIRMCQEALRTYDAVGSLPGVVDGLEDAAMLFADRNWYELAARLFAAAEALRETGGLARAPVDSDAHDRCVDAVAEVLGDQWERARIEGRSLSSAEAVATACVNRGQRVRGAKGWASLTQAEREVARLVAGGLTSADAAARLFVSRRTVETHLAHVYAKLGIHSRKDLSAWTDVAEGDDTGLSGP